jgi:hypothetical protein
MAIEDNLDQLYAETIANRIVIMRLWNYFAEVAAKAEGDTKAKYMERQLKQCLEAVDMWHLHGHRNPDNLKRMAKAAITGAFQGIVEGRSAGSPLQ